MTDATTVTAPPDMVINAIERLRVQPGDVLVISTPLVIPPAGRAHFEAWLKERVGPDVRIMVLEGGATLQLLHVGEEEARAVVERDDRQAQVREWCVRCFGEETQEIGLRALRMLEEAIETYQAAGGDPAKAVELVRFVFARPVGELPQEIGGLGLTVLALAAAAGVSADGEERREIARVLSKTPEHFRARDQAKRDAGFSHRAPPAGDGS